MRPVSTRTATPCCENGLGSSAGARMPKSLVTLRAHRAHRKGQFVMKSRLVRIAIALAGLAALAVVTGASGKFH